MVDTAELESVIALLRSDAFESKVEGRQRALQLAQSIDSVDSACSALKQLLAIDEEAAQVFLDSWCAKTGVSDVRAAMRVAVYAADRSLHLASDIQRQLGETVLENSDTFGQHRDLAMRWLATCEGPLRLSAPAQRAVVDAACSPSTPRRTKENATDCVEKIEHFADDAMDRFVKWLEILPGTFWHDRLVRTSGGSLACQLAAEQLRSRVDACLLGSSKKCDRRIDPGFFVFVAHPFAPSVGGPLRRVLAVVEHDLGCVRFVYADKVQEDGTVSCKICRHIRMSRLALFDLTSDCLVEGDGFCDRAKANPNVTLELGLAFAYGAATVLIARRGPRPPVDLAGHQIEFFDDYGELIETLTSRIAQILQEPEAQT